MEKHYLDIDFKNNCFYEYSKVAREGFESQTNSAGKESFVKLYNKGVFGTLESMQVVDTKYQGKKLVLRLLNGDDVYLAGFQMYDQRGNFDNRFVEPLISMIPNLVKGQAYRVFPWAMESETYKTRNGKFKVNYGVSIKKADLNTMTVLTGEDAKISPKYVRRKKDEAFDASKHLPDLVFVDEFGSLKPTAISVDARKQFFVKMLTAGLENLGYVPNQAAPEKAVQESNTQPTPLPTEPVNMVEEDYDDLPF